MVEMEMRWEEVVVIMTCATFMIQLIKTVAEVWYRYKRIKLEHEKIGKMDGEEDE